jgi:hypothetical protein
VDGGGGVQQQLGGEEGEERDGVVVPVPFCFVLLFFCFVFFLFYK